MYPPIPPLPSALFETYSAVSSSHSALTAHLDNNYQNDWIKGQIVIVFCLHVKNSRSAQKSAGKVQWYADKYPVMSVQLKCTSFFYFCKISKNYEELLISMKLARMSFELILNYLVEKYIFVSISQLVALKLGQNITYQILVHNPPILFSSKTLFARYFLKYMAVLWNDRRGGMFDS